MDSENIIVVENLHKSFGDVHAVDGISFSVKRGQMFAFLGPNGAGKSTTISMICTLVKADSGSITIDGIDVMDPKVKSMFGIVFQESLLDKDLTVKENLVFAARLYSIPEKEIPDLIESIVDSMQLSDIANRRYGTLSGGQRRRADVSRALVNRPKLLILDEPSTGLDPQSRKLIWELIGKLCKEKGMTLFFTTHYMEEAANADNIVIISHGKISAEGAPDQLRERYSSDRIRMFPSSFDALSSKLSSDGMEFHADGQTIVVDIPDTLSSIDIVGKYRNDITGFEVLMGTMEDAFINIISEEGLL